MSCCAPSAGKRSAPASEIGPELIPPCWDAHNHLQLSRRDTGACALWGICETPSGDVVLALTQERADIQKLVEERSLVVSLMGTQPDDWQHTQELTARLPAKIRPNFGLHPWWAHDYESPEPDSGWMLELRAALESDPSSCLGEIGLDGQWVPPGLQEVQYEQQMDAFRQQLQLAVDLNRPVSLHCVKAYGDMFDILRTAPALPPAVYMHSWGGKIGMLESYVKMKKFGDRFYFGFSSFANLRQNCHKTSAVIAAVPDDRLLLESDLEDPSDVPEALHQMLHVMAEAKGWSVEETARITMRNAEVPNASASAFCLACLLGDLSFISINGYRSL